MKKAFKIKIKKINNGIFLKNKNKSEIVNFLCKLNQFY